jgi:glutamate-1-semialdehyde 2,1-aminomutase
MAGTPGVPAAISETLAVLPWDDPDGVERALADRTGQLAAIIIEPVQGAGGIRTADPAFLRFLRDFTSQHGALLIFDEIISFRVGPSGAQGRLGVLPDLTALGKIIGGGYPLAAFGGRADVMDAFDARREGALSHGGTFNGNPVAAAAGLATLRELTPDAYAHLETLGNRVRDRLEEGFARVGSSARIDGIGSLFQIWANDESTAATATGSGTPSFWLGMLLEGFSLAPRGMGAIPVVATEADIDDLAAAAIRTVESLALVPA